MRELFTSGETTLFLTLFSFAWLLMTVLTLHTSAGLSRYFIAFSSAGSLLLSISSQRWYIILAYLIRFLITVALFVTLTFVHRLKSGRFRDHRRMLLAVPAALILSLSAYIDAGHRECLNFLGRWLCVFGILCQVYLTKQCRRITIFKPSLPLHFTIIVTHSLNSLTAAFKASGSEMWALWLTGMTGICLGIDFLYFVVHAKYKNGSVDLPHALRDSQNQ
jgi:hypothetical protein